MSDYLMAPSSSQPPHLARLSHSPAQTRRIGAILGNQLQAGDIVLLQGRLGVGKTCFAQGLAQGLGLSEPVKSSSFTLVNYHLGRLPMYHIDLYRLEDEEALLQLGLEDYLYSDGVCVVEWGERLIGTLAQEYLLVHIVDHGGTRRLVNMVSCGARYSALLRLLETQLKALST